MAGHQGNFETHLSNAHVTECSVSDVDMSVNNVGVSLKSKKILKRHLENAHVGTECFVCEQIFIVLFVNNRPLAKTS